MPINFIPNDPLALSSIPMRKIKARSNRPAASAGFRFINPVKKQAEYAVGTPDFLFWQCREAALMALETWETLHGKLSQWAQATPQAKLINLEHNAGSQLNAYYDGQSVSFFEYTTPNKSTFSGASTDVVAHEVGHGLLDTIRPDIWDSKLLEVNATHEGFGDCIAILTALSDKETREALLKVSPNLDTPNFVEATAEDLADGVAQSPDPRLGPTHPAGAARHALNDFKWQLPTTMPSWGSPDVMIAEEHSLGRILSGCFYDLIRNIFSATTHKSQEALWTAAQTAGKILIAGVEKAPEKPRFFQSVGRAMVIADQTLNGGANRDSISKAFQRHNVAIGSSMMLAPRATLAGTAPSVRGRAGVTLAAATRTDLKNRIGAAPASRLSIVPKTIGGEEVIEAVNRREVSLSGLDKRLKGVVAVATETVLVGSVERRAAVLSDLPEANTTTDEVHAYIKSLLDNDMIDFDKAATAGGSTKRAAAARRGVVAGAAGGGRQDSNLKTHTIRARAGKQVVERVRFMCRHEG